MAAPQRVPQPFLDGLLRRGFVRRAQPGLDALLRAGATRPPDSPGNDARRQVARLDRQNAAARRRNISDAERTRAATYARSISRRAGGASAGRSSGT